MCAADAAPSHAPSAEAALRLARLGRQARTHATLHFINVLAETAAQHATLKGTLFQVPPRCRCAATNTRRVGLPPLASRSPAPATMCPPPCGRGRQRTYLLNRVHRCTCRAPPQALMTAHAAEQQRLREAEERRLAELEAAQAAVDSAPSAAAAPLAPCLQALPPAEVVSLGAAGAELRGLLRIKVEDDQDLLTAQRALAECAHFLLLARAEAPKRELTEAELLRKLDLGEG